MKDGNWELIDGSDAHEIEVLNYSNQINVIEACVKFMMFHAVDGDVGPPHPDILRELHRTATLFLLAKPGEFRDLDVHVQKAGSVVFEPPPHVNVGLHLDTFFRTVNANWGLYSAVEIAAYSLWMINWIHPFRNGNGRTARAFCYLCLSLKLGFIIPGSPTVIDLIMQDREEYETGLQLADADISSRGKPGLLRLEGLIARLLEEQLVSVLGAGAASGST